MIGTQEQPFEIHGVQELGIWKMARKCEQKYGVDVEDAFQEIVVGIIEAAQRDTQGKYTPANRLYYGYNHARMVYRKQLGIDSRKEAPVFISIDAEEVIFEPSETIDYTRHALLSTEAISTAMKDITHRQRVICSMLADGRKRKDICKAVDISHTWLLHEIREIRSQFEAAGLTF